MLYTLITLIHSYPLELKGIYTDDDIQSAILNVNVSPPYDLALCYTRNHNDKESWTVMKEYSADYKEVMVDLPEEGDYNVYYSFRVMIGEYYSFCQPFRYTKNDGYVVIDKDYEREMSKKIKIKKDKKDKEKDDKVDKEDKEDKETILIQWIGLIFVVFIVLCLVAIFSSGGSGGI